MVGWGDASPEGAWVELRGVARYLYHWQSNQVVATPRPGASRHRVEEWFARFALPMLLQHQGLEFLHAGGVVVGDGVAAICGFSGMGKSSLVAALARRGYPSWADDALAVMVEGAQPVSTVRLPFARRLDPEGWALVESLRGIDAGPAGTVGDVRPLAAVVVLQRVEAGLAPSAAPAEAARAFTALLEHAQFFSISRLAARRRLSEHLLALVAQVPVLLCRFPPDRAAFAEVVSMVAAGIRSATLPAAGGSGA